MSSPKTEVEVRTALQTLLPVLQDLFSDVLIIGVRKCPDSERTKGGEEFSPFWFSSGDPEVCGGLSLWTAQHMSDTIMSQIRQAAAARAAKGGPAVSPPTVPSIPPTK